MANNTIYSGGPVGHIVLRSGNSLNVLDMRNNHWISSANPAVCTSIAGGCGSTNSLINTNNITMTPTVSGNQGYTVANKFAPTRTPTRFISAPGQEHGLRTIRHLRIPTLFKAATTPLRRP